MLRHVVAEHARYSLRHDGILLAFIICVDFIDVSSPTARVIRVTGRHSEGTLHFHKSASHKAWHDVRLDRGHRETSSDCASSHGRSPAPARIDEVVERHLNTHPFSSAGAAATPPPCSATLTIECCSPVCCVSTEDIRRSEDVGRFHRSHSQCS